MYKWRSFISALCEQIDSLSPKRMVEVGVHEGGSSIYWENRYKPARLSLVDINPNVPHLSSYILRHGLSDRMRLHLGVSQDDADEIRSAMADDFGAEPIDLVIDDASHMLDRTRRTFEILFPYLRPGGLYIIEDWGWGHFWFWGQELWAEHPLMSPLISEIMLVCAASSGIVGQMHINPNFAAITRGPAPLPCDGSFNLLANYKTRSGFPYQSTPP
jgi:hypothetical protein